MGSSSKSAGSEAAKTYDYYGTIAGVLCHGRVSKLFEIVADGHTIYSNSSGLSRPANGLPSTLTTDRGTIRFYWGTPEQGTDALLDGSESLGETHSPMKWVSYLVLVDFLFGREKLSAPNIEVVLQRDAECSLVDENLIESTELAAKSDGDVNPIAWAAELMENPRAGLGMDSGAVDRKTLTKAVGTLASKSNLTHSSPLLAGQIPFRKAWGMAEETSECWLRFNQLTGKISVGRWNTGDEITVGSLPTILTQDLTEPFRLKTKGWESVPTSYQMKFQDRNRAFKKNSTRASDLHAMRARKTTQVMNVTREQITDPVQAERQLLEIAKREGKPGAQEGTLGIRRNKLKSLGILVGDHFKIDLDPEPGGDQLIYVCRLVKTSEKPQGSVSLDFKIEKTLAPVAVDGDAWEALADVDLKPGSILEADSQLVVLPPLLADAKNGRISMLANRPDTFTTGFELEWTKSASEPYESLGSTPHFAIKALVDAEINPADTSLALDLSEALDDDLQWLLNFDSPSQARALDVLLLSVKDRDTLEVMTLESVTAESWNGAQLLITVKRGMWGTVPEAYGEGANYLWIIRKNRLPIFFSADFMDLFGSSTYPKFRLKTFNPVYQLDPDVDTVPVYDALQFPTTRKWDPVITITTPSTDPSTITNPGTLTVAGSVEDKDGNLSFVQIQLIKNGILVASEVNNFLEEMITFNFSEDFSISEDGTFTARVIAKDRDGITVKKDMTIQAGSAGGTSGVTADPVLDPPGALLEEGDSVSVDVTCATSGATVHYSITSYGASSPGSYSTTPAPASITVDADESLWVYCSSSGRSDSSVIKGNYPERINPGTDPR